MSVYIKGMEMPQNCGECLLAKLSPTGESLICNYMLSRVSWEERPFDCPLVPVPPHGRLIDADALMLEIQEYIEEYSWETDEHGWHNEKWCAMKEAAMAIDAAPTIIEAEEGE